MVHWHDSGGVLVCFFRVYFKYNLVAFFGILMKYTIQLDTPTPKAYLEVLPLPVYNSLFIPFHLPHYTNQSEFFFYFFYLFF